MCMFYTRQQQRKQLTAYQVLVLFCRQDFGNSGRKVSGTLEIISKKSPRFWKLLDTAFKTLETSGQSLNNFGIVTTSKVSSARWKQRIVLTMVQWFRNQALKSVSFCKAKQHNYCPWKSWLFGNDAITITLCFLRSLRLVGSGCNFTR